MSDKINDLLHRWRTAAENAERASALEGGTAATIARREAQAETYRACIADVNAVLTGPGGNR